MNYLWTVFSKSGLEQCFPNLVAKISKANFGIPDLWSGLWITQGNSDRVVPKTIVFELYHIPKKFFGNWEPKFIMPVMLREFSLFWFVICLLSLNEISLISSFFQKPFILWNRTVELADYPEFNVAKEEDNISIRLSPSCAVT